MRLQLSHLRRQAIATTFFKTRTLGRALQRLRFVQADPIRSPARAQDLILRHRVEDYRVGDLERRYRSLHLEEDFLYAYGFMPESTWQLLHPRREGKLSRAEEQVLELVSAHKRIHPRDLEAYFGREREVNDWGGYSKTTTRALHHLHFRGLLRVVGRENGIRLYEPVRKQRDSLEARERLRQTILLVAGILAPVPDKSLFAALRLVSHHAPGVRDRHSTFEQLLNSGDLACATVDGVRYVWPSPRVTRIHAEDSVRFLAPFDPLVWDRRRFEHFWGWAYRFEAYTPPSKRKLGYYAMPLLWRDDVIGWVNISPRQGRLKVTPGFVKGKPGEAAFRREFEAETERFRAFLKSREED